jgi:hypothetical protein
MDHHHWRRLLSFLAVAMLALAAASLAADPPVAVTYTTTGAPVPGATVSVKATVKVNDGSTLQSLSWSQTGGLPATLSGKTTDTLSVVLPDRKAYKHHLIEVLEEFPVAEAQLPAKTNKEHFFGGLQDRFQVVSMSPHAVIDAGAVPLKLTVTTSSGTYNFTTSVAGKLPWPTATGLRNVPIGLPVLLHGKTQASYNWALAAKPAASKAVLEDATTQDPEFVPDAAGTYEITVTDAVYAGKWEGIIAGKDSKGLPVIDTACTKCHVPSTPYFDQFTPWKASGHAEIVTTNVNNPAGHYSESCVSCHTVGYDKNVVNGGIDDLPDWKAFTESGLLTHGAVDNWTKILANYPNVAKMANIQCDNCHGPTSLDIPVGQGAHGKKDGARKTQSSDLCGTCHGEPLRHGRFQQWQLSLHANYETAAAEGTNPSCAKCHSSQGFIQWANNKFSTAAIKVDWNTDSVHPITCAACHDPHAVGTTSGSPNSNATVRIAGTTPMLDAGFAAENVGRGAVCMTCHNGRRGLKDDQHALTDFSRAPHVGPQTDVIMGRNMYFTTVGTRGNHANIEDVCVTCHMESSPPPAALSYNQAGTNHTFFAKAEICQKCHSSITLASVQEPVEHKMEVLKEAIETGLANVMKAQLRAGNAIDIGGTKITTPGDVAHVEFIESHGRQGVTVTLGNGKEVADIALNSVKVVPPAGAAKELLALADPALAKAGWNYFMVHSDKSKGAHNPAFVNSALDVSLFAIQAMNTATTVPGVGMRPGIAGGPGDGTGAVACNTPYVYWTEIAAHLAGAYGSEWRTDVVARNLGAAQANLKFVLHQYNGNIEGSGTIGARSQKAFEDIVLALGGSNAKGSVEICSDQPLLIAGRTFSASATGTFGQNFDGHVASLGYNSGETVSLIGMRQQAGLYRTNINVTNASKAAAEVAVVLYDAAGTQIHTYNLTVPAGQVIQDLEPFANRANQPNLGWGFATVTVVKGTNIRASAALIDNRTNDPTTIEAKQ